MCDDEVLNELLKIVDLAVVPIAADELVRGAVELALKPPILQVLNNIFNIQGDGSASPMNRFDDVILTETQRLKLDRFLYVVNRIPVVRLRQRSVKSYDNLIDLGVFHNLKSLILEHINLQKLRWTSHLKTQLVSLSGGFCSEIEAVFCDKLYWAELVDLTLQYCRLEPSNNVHYFRNAPWLTILNLSYCKLRSCEFLVNLHLLEHLNLSYNFLRKLPTLSEISELKTLKMDNNCVQELSGIERIPSLKYFDLSHNWLPNKYSLMPLENAENLVTIKLAGCPVSFVKYYRIYVAMCICTKTPASQVEIDGVALSKTEQSVLGLNLLKNNTDLDQPSSAPVVDGSLPSTSANILEEPPVPSCTPGKSKPLLKKSLVRVPVIHDESLASPKEAESPSNEVERDDDVPRAPTVVPKGPIASVNFTLTEELRAIQEAILRAPTSSQASRTPQENGMHTTIIKPDHSKLHLGGITIPSFMTLIYDDDSPIPEIVPEKVFALVHATESEDSQDDSNRNLESKRKCEDGMENDGSIANIKGSQSRVIFVDQDVCEKDLSYDTREELSKKLEEELFTALDERNNQATNVSENVHVELNSNNPAPSGSETTSDEQLTVVRFGMKAWDHISDSGAGSDMKTSSESDEKHGSDGHGQPCADTEVSDEEFCSSNSKEPDETSSLTGEVTEFGEVIIEEKHPEKINGSPKDSDEESCYESDPDADEFLWHVMRVDPTTKVNQPIFLALLENELKERSPKSGETLTKWSLELVLSCVKTKNLPITIEMEFDTVKKDKQHREYIMEYADAQALTKKIYNILESRPLSAMNQVSHNCLKCSTIFVFSCPSVFGAKDSSPSCPVCGSMVVVEMEEPKKPENNYPAPKPLSHSPSQSSIGSARSMEHGLKPEALLNPRKYESDIEVISNPSQSSIEVIDESSRSQSVTPMRKKSEERQTAFTTEQNIREMLSPLSALTESSSSGSLTESVITAYESSSVIINKKSFECLSEASCENSPSENSLSFATKGTSEEENGNVAGPKCVKDVYSFTDFLHVELRVKTFIYHSIFKSENEELCALVRCHIWKTGGSDYDGCFVLSTSAVYFLYHKMTDFSDQICDWLSLNESFRITDLKRVQPIIWYQGLEIQIKNFSFILLLMDGDRTQNLTKHFNSLSLKGLKVVAKPNPKVELSLQQSVLSNDLSHNSEDPSVIYMVLCRSLEITKVEVEEEELLRLAGLVLTCGLFIVIPGDLSWLCSGAQPSIVASRDLSSLIEVEKKGMQLVFHFLDEAEALEEIWSIKFGVDSQIDPLLDAIRRPWERRFSVPLEITGL